MCAPAAVLVPLIATGVTGGLEVAGAVQARNEAGRQQQQQEKYELQNKISAARSTRLALEDLSAREAEELLATAHEQSQMRLDANEAQSTAIVAAGEAGVGGSSVEALMNSLKIKESRNVQTSEINNSIALAQLQRDKEAAIAQGISQQNGVQHTEIRKPSLLPSFLKIGSQALGTVDYLQQRTALRNQPIRQP